MLTLSAGREAALGLALRLSACPNANHRAINRRFLFGFSRNRSMRNCNANENTKMLDHSHPLVGYADLYLAKKKRGVFQTPRAVHFWGKAQELNRFEFPAACFRQRERRHDQQPIGARREDADGMPQ